MIDIEPDFFKDEVRYRENGWWRDRTLIADFLDAANEMASKEAICAYVLGDPTPTRLTFGELAALVERIAAGLVSLGIGAGDVVACQLANGWELVALTLATYRVGAVICPIVPILRMREVSFILRETKARIVVTRSNFRKFNYADMYHQIRKDFDLRFDLLMIDVDVTSDESFHGVLLEGNFNRAELSNRPLPLSNDLAEILFTSGTTGEPKGVLHTHNTEFARSRAFFEPLRLTRDDVVFMSSTMGHSSGFLYGLCVPMMLGMKAVYLDIHDADAMLDAIERENVTWSMGSTTFVIDAIAAQRRTARNLATFRLFASGGAPIPPKIVEDARTSLGTRVVAIWGMTENGGVTATPHDASWNEAAFNDGRPAPWMELRICGEDGNQLPPNSAGALKVRGASQTPGYLNRPDVYRRHRDPQGWFDTGDIAYITDNGSLRISGRSKDMIIRGGENIPVVEVESAIFMMGRVREVAVVGYPDDRLGERACAYVVPAGEGTALTLNDIADFLGALGMSKTYFPEKLRIVDHLPKTMSGKVQKFVLRDMISAETLS